MADIYDLFLYPTFPMPKVAKNNAVSPLGNRTPVSHVIGGDTFHYTNEEDT